MQLSSGPSDTGNRPRFGRAIIFVIAGVALLGFYLARSHTPSAPSNRGAGATADSLIIPAQMILPADFDDGTRFSGRVIAVLEPVQEVLLPELRPVEKALGHMLVTDLASDSNLRVVSREMLAALRKRLGVGEPKAAAPVKGEQVTLAVFDFEPGGPVADLDQHSADLADLLTNYLSDAGATLVERKQLEAILREQRLIQAQRNGADQARLGRLLARSVSSTPPRSPGTCPSPGKAAHRPAARLRPGRAACTPP